MFLVAVYSQEYILMYLNGHQHFYNVHTFFNYYFALIIIKQLMSNFIQNMLFKDLVLFVSHYKYNCSKSKLAFSQNLVEQVTHVLCPKVHSQTYISVHF